ncbi:enamelin [Anopheles sinensis]|uniref:Enamelin n=1 Tax=Anopheles sinensis TaxID=74873 RepID=A0A084WFG1_ANOSI|nr:enamelin [Anopheles sinensis]
MPAVFEVGSRKPLRKWSCTCSLPNVQLNVVNPSVPFAIAWLPISTTSGIRFPLFENRTQSPRPNVDENRNRAGSSAVCTVG